MKLNAVAVTSSNMQRSITFYTLPGFDFSDSTGEEEHVEPKAPEGSARLMIDKKAVIADIIGEAPKPSNHSNFAIQFDSPAEIDMVCQKISGAGFSIFKEPRMPFGGSTTSSFRIPTVISLISMPA